MDRLAGMLGVSKWALEALGVGYGMVDGFECWTFPERNPDGLIVGLTLRLVEEDGAGRTKKAARGSRRGLSYADRWADYPGPVYIVEGGSDVAAGLTLGLAVIGRPSNTGGGAMLEEILRGINRPVVVMGERDRKTIANLKGVARQQHQPPHHCPGCEACWPGRYGAELLAKKLSQRLGCEVRMRMPPNMAKDLRAWLNGLRLDLNDETALLAARKRMIR